jgi:hypothetical protein
MTRMTRPIKKIVLLPPVRETEEVEVELMRRAAQAHVTLSEIRRRAYRMFLWGDPFEDGGTVGAAAQEHADSVFPDSDPVQSVRASQGVTR